MYNCIFVQVLYKCIACNHCKVDLKSGEERTHGLESRAGYLRIE